MIKVTKCILSLMTVLCINMGYAQVNYLQESKKDFDKRMHWFREAKYGMFIHFGLYSQLGGIYKRNSTKGYAEWIQSEMNIPKDAYSELINTWNPKDFNAGRIVQLPKDAGMKYIVLTTKHHEGFCLWDSPAKDYDIASTPIIC